MKKIVLTSVTTGIDTAIEFFDIPLTKTFRPNLHKVNPQHLKVQSWFEHKGLLPQYLQVESRTWPPTTSRPLEKPLQLQKSLKNP